MKKVKLILLFSIFYFLFSISFCSAAVLYLEPSSGDYHQGDVFLVEVRLDTQGEYINAAEVHLNYPEDILEFNDFSQGNSILTVLVKEPSVSNGEVSFVGGIPGGYQGADGLLAKIAFKAGAANRAEVKLSDNSQVLLNDGKGTAAILTVRGAVLNILAGQGAVDEWQEEMKKDKILPEPFRIELGQDASIFDGKYFIIFSTTDKQTGIDHYEIREGKRDWEKATSPYVLKNQKLTSDIKIKAIDKAGNFWMETLEAPNQPKIQREIYAGLGLVLILVIIIIIKKVKRKAKDAKQQLKT